VTDEESCQSIVEKRLLRVDREVIREGPSWLQGLLSGLDRLEFDILIEIQVLLIVIPVIPSVLLPADLEHRMAIVSLSIPEDLLRLLLRVMLEPLCLKQGCLPLRGLLESTELVGILSRAEDLLVSSVRIDIASSPSLRPEVVAGLLTFHKVRARRSLDLEHGWLRVMMKVMAWKSLESLTAPIPSMYLARTIREIVVVVIEPRVSFIFLLMLVHIKEVLSLLQPVLEG
jgi:hypothetical protein